MFEVIAELVLGHEGSFTDDPRDPGNWTDKAFGQKGGILKGTKYGISAASYPSLDIKNLSLAKAREIYRQNYWEPIGGDELGRQIGGGMMLVLFDTAINSGVSRALKFLQNWKSPETYLSGRLAWMQTLAIWTTYGRGWTKRINSLRSEAAQLDLMYPVIPKRAELPVKVINVESGIIGRLSGVRRVWLDGVQLDDSELDSVSIVGDKLYVNLGRKGE